MQYELAKKDISIPIESLYLTMKRLNYFIKMNHCYGNKIECYKWTFDVELQLPAWHFRPSKELARAIESASEEQLLIFEKELDNIEDWLYDFVGAVDKYLINHFNRKNNQIMKQQNLQK